LKFSLDSNNYPTSWYTPNKWWTKSIRWRPRWINTATSWPTLSNPTTYYTSKIFTIICRPFISWKSQPYWTNCWWSCMSKYSICEEKSL